MPDSAEQLRRQIRTLQAERRSLESKLMQPQPMLAASLIERFLRAGDTSRAAPAYYLSRSEHGRSMLTYVKKEELAVVRQHCTAYRAFQQNLKEWQRVEQDIVEGRPFEAFISERGRFDGMLDFLLRFGIWAAATEMRPSGLKKDNGIPYRLLNGVECLREMAGIDTPANCGPLLKDSYLLERIGFTAEK